MRFVALRDFWCAETASMYVTGLSYQVRPQDEVLRAMLPQWIEQDLVKAGGGDATLTGRD